MNFWYRSGVTVAFGPSMTLQPCLKKPFQGRAHAAHCDVQRHLHVPRQIDNLFKLAPFAPMLDSFVKELSLERIPRHYCSPRRCRRRLASRDFFPQAKHDWHARGFPPKLRLWDDAVGPMNIFGIRKMPVVRCDCGAPALDIFGPGKPLAEHDLVVARIGIKEKSSRNRAPAARETTMPR